MKNRYVIFVLTLILFSACTDKFEEFNEDRKNPTEVPAATLFNYAQAELSDQISSTNVNLNVWKLWAQYWTETTYIDEANYDILNRTVADLVFRQLYRNVLKHFKDASDRNAADELLTAAEKASNQAIIDIQEIYTYQRLLDIFGDVPRSEALIDSILAPVFDDAETMYSDLGNELINAINVLETNGDGTWGASDAIYGGSAEMWVKFANGLLVKMGATLSDVNPTLAETWITTGEAGAFESSADNALYQYGTSYPHTNTLYEDLVLSGRSDFVAANTIIDIMNDLNDPRLYFYFQQTDTSSEEGVTKLAFVGGDYGWPSPYAQYSHVGTELHQPDFPGILMTYSELLFYYAEAAERSFAVSRTAEEYYNDGVTASVNWWAAQYGTTADAAAYLAQAEVAYGTAAGDWKQKIGTQSWLASYSRGFLGYTTWRRLDYPIFNLAERAATHADIPTRFTYPIYEQTLNGPNYEAAAAAVGGDELTTPLFWDLFPVNTP